MTASFAGTWRELKARTVAIIAPRDDGYDVTLYRWTLQDAERSGDPCAPGLSCVRRTAS